MMRFYRQIGKKMVYLKDALIGKGEGVIAFRIHAAGEIRIGFKNIMFRNSSRLNWLHFKL